MIRRRAARAVRDALRRQAAVALLGPRQVGKTTPAHEIKRDLAGGLGKGAQDALADLRPKRAFVVHAGEDRHPVTGDVEAIGLRGLMGLLLDG